MDEERRNDVRPITKSDLAWNEDNEMATMMAVMLVRY
jgi:hypothetical protein